MEKSNNTKIYNIMGCRLTKNGNGYNVALVHDDVDNSKKYANVFLKKERARLVETDEGKKGITIFIPIFEDKDGKDADTKEVFSKPKESVRK